MTLEEQQLALIIKGIMADELKPLYQELKEIRAELAEGDTTSAREGQRMFVSWREKFSWMWVALGALALLLMQIAADKLGALIGG